MTVLLVLYTPALRCLVLTKKVRCFFPSLRDYSGFALYNVPVCFLTPENSMGL